VAASDGLWDNAFDKEILGLLPRDPSEVDDAAARIAALARRHAADTKFSSPYTQSAVQQGYDLPWWEKLAGMRFSGGRLKLKQLSGGKMDDITVLVAMVVADAAPPAPAPAPPAPADAAPASVGSS